MDTRTCPLALALALLGLGCASTAPPGTGGFQFFRDGAVYQIVADRVGTEPVNDLVRHEGGEVVVWARDRDQDGTLDTVLVGPVPLADANAIYTFGIERAREQGFYSVREHARTYTTTYNGSRIIAWSIAKGGADWLNRFGRYGPDGRFEIYVDTDADGHLDEGDGALGAPQRAYEHLLETGLRTGRVEEVDARFRVALSAPPS